MAFGASNETRMLENSAIWLACRRLVPIFAFRNATPGRQPHISGGHRRGCSKSYARDRPGTVPQVLRRLGIYGRYFWTAFRLNSPRTVARPRNERFLDAALAHWFRGSRLRVRFGTTSSAMTPGRAHRGGAGLTAWKPSCRRLAIAEIPRRAQSQRRRPTSGGCQIGRVAGRCLLVKH
jgi:hypothetical protein